VPGETLFIMGSSGAGKTSLLNIISDRVKKTKENRIEGEILINDNVVMKQETFGQIGAYVM
jgi:ABC-type multidrug transport system ATPase subunit